MAASPEPGIRRILLQGGQVETLASDVRVGFYRLAGDHIYFEANGTIQRIAKSGGAPTVVVPKQNRHVQLGPEHVYWAEGDLGYIFCLKRIPR